MTRTEYYEVVKAKAREVRETYGLDSPKVTLTDLRRIYKREGIKIDKWKGPLKRCRGLYTNGEDGPCVMVVASLPTEQRIFTLAHELKHHIFDRPGSPILVEKDLSEKSAEVFAVELIFPDKDFIAHMKQMRVALGGCTREDVVRLKQLSGTTLSYTSLAKRAEFLRFAAKGSLGKDGWHKLRDSMFGEPAYKRIRRFKVARRDS